MDTGVAFKSVDVVSQKGIDTKNALRPAKVFRFCQICGIFRLYENMNARQHEDYWEIRACQLYSLPPASLSSVRSTRST